MAKIYNPSWFNWLKIWKLVGPPWRPSKNDVAFMEKMIKMVLEHEKNPKALVMGCTPEIRNLLAKYKIEATLVDINPDMKRAMGELMTRKNLKEKLIVANWLDVKLPNNYFDLAFSDGCESNLAFKTWNKYYSIIKKALKKESLFYDAAWVYKINEPWTFDDLIKKYKKDPKYFSDFKNRLFSLYRLMREPGLYNKKKKEFDFGKIIWQLQKHIERRDINQSDLKKIQWIEFNLGPYVEIAFDDAEEHKKYFKKHFEIVDAFQDNSHPIMSFRMDFILRKK